MESGLSCSKIDWQELSTKTSCQSSGFGRNFPSNISHFSCVSRSKVRVSFDPCPPFSALIAILLASAFCESKPKPACPIHVFPIRDDLDICERRAIITNTEHYS